MANPAELTQPVPGGGSRLVWRLCSPTSRQLSCQVRPFEGQFVLAVRDEHHEIVTARAAEIETLHAKAVAWRTALEAQGYVPPGHGAAASAGSRAGSSEARAAFRGLLECAELLGLEDRAAAVVVRDAAVTGLVAIGLRDADMVRDVVSQCRNALSRVRAEGSDISALLGSCEALLRRLEGLSPSALGNPW